jgi:hypothetical protein
MFLGLLIMTAALLRTGVVGQVGRWISRRAGPRPQRLLVFVVIAVAALGAFISNTASTAFFLPVVIGIAARTSTSPTKLLMPLAFGSILSSSVSLVSTSTNIIVSGLMQQSGLAAMGMFELAPVGLPIVVVGIAYVLTIGRRLMPDRGKGGVEPAFGLGPYLTEVVIRPGSNLIGRTLGEAGLGRTRPDRSQDYARGSLLAPRSNARLGEGDVLLVEGRRQDVLKIKDIAGIDIGQTWTWVTRTCRPNVRLVEAIVPQVRHGRRTLRATASGSAGLQVWRYTAIRDSDVSCAKFASEWALFCSCRATSMFWPGWRVIAASASWAPSMSRAPMCDGRARPLGSSPPPCSWPPWGSFPFRWRCFWVLWRRS